MIKGVTHAHLGTIWNNSEPSDVPYSPNQFLALDFFCRFLQYSTYFAITIYRSMDVFKFLVKKQKFIHPIMIRIASAHGTTYLQCTW